MAATWTDVADAIIAHSLTSRVTGDQVLTDGNEELVKAPEQPIARGPMDSLDQWALGEAVGLWLCGTPRPGFPRRSGKR